jgi:hypothetical protein
LAYVERFVGITLRESELLAAQDRIRARFAEARAKIQKASK